MGKQKQKKLKLKDDWEPTEEAIKFQKEHRRKLRQLREQTEAESVFPPKPWYEDDGV